jgi:hypothetical protein
VTPPRSARRQGGPIELRDAHPVSAVFVDGLLGELGVGEPIGRIEQLGAHGEGLREGARGAVGPRGVVEDLLAPRADIGLSAPARVLHVLVPEGEIPVSRLAVERSRLGRLCLIRLPHALFDGQARDVPRYLVQHAAGLGGLGLGLAGAIKLQILGDFGGHHIEAGGALLLGGHVERIEREAHGGPAHIGVRVGHRDRMKQRRGDGKLLGLERGASSAKDLLGCAGEGGRVGRLAAGVGGAGQGGREDQRERGDLRGDGGGQAGCHFAPRSAGAISRQTGMEHGGSRSS